MRPSGSSRPSRVLLAIAFTLLAFAPSAPAAEPGLRVQVDPETGTYSLPPPEALPAAPTSGGAAPAEEAAEVVITPGRSPAGGFKATFRREAELRTEPHR